jgi:tetratricopeptide (TPR) repeat protein
MTAGRWQQIEAIFLQAVERPPSERPRFLDEACGGDLALRGEVESLLSCDSPGERLVEIPAGFELGDGGTCGDLTGRRIGPYQLIRLIGHGGMGAVYLGIRDDDQYRKHVAIKLLKRGMDTDFMLARFRQERQILANLEHPFIARLLDGGATGDGLPYLVMEYVDGIPITDYCAGKNLSIPEILRLFRLVCEAVQHAHQNLVVHRDIKPSNILTTREGVPKLLDFGIAKVLQPGAAGETLTQGELRMLTPDYASPEQVRAAPISTASDIYSLGAVLYELLSGRRAHQFPSGSLADLEKTICETPPEKPSAAAGNNADPPALRRQKQRRLCGDLDNIVLTALHKEPQRRYASAAEFSDDLRRHMECLPVRAQADRWTYRAGKFVRRNRFAAGASLLLVASLIGGIVATTMQARRAERRFQLARGLAKAVVDHVGGPLARVPGSTAARVAIIQDVVRYLDGLARDASRDPAFALQIADAYREVASIEAHPFRANLGQTAAAMEHFEKAIGIFSTLTSHPAAKTHALGGFIGANIEAGDIETRLGNPAAAKARLQKAAAVAAEATARDRGALSPGTWVYLYFRLHAMASRAGGAAESLNYARLALEKALEFAAAEKSVNSRGTLRGAYSNLADTQVDNGDLRAARENFETALRIAQDNVRQDNSTVYERSMLSASYQDLGDLLGGADELNFAQPAAALSHSREALRIAESIAAADRVDVRALDDVAGALRSLGGILRLEQPAEALKTYQRALSISRNLSAAHPANTKYRRDTALAQAGMGQSLHRLARDREAREVLEPALETMKALAAAAPDEVPLAAWVSRMQRSLGDARLAAGGKDAAESYTQALAVAQDLVQRAPTSMRIQRLHADALESMGAYYLTLARKRPELKVQAEQLFRKSLAVWHGWTAQKIGSPYAAAREAQAIALLASLNAI